MAKWGNPETASFERQYLRWARHGDKAVHVHKGIWPMVERILIGLDANEVDLRAIAETDDPLKLGFVLPGADSELVNALIRDGKFAYEDDVVRFTGTADEAEAIAKALGAEAEQEDDEPEPEVIPADEPRGEMVEPFDHTATEGAWVVFMQHLVGVEDATGEYDGWTNSRIRDWQRRNGLAETGVGDEAAWAFIVPRRVTWMRPGATGLQVKVIQAALKTHGYYEPKVTGVWGMEMSRSLRRFQHDHGIHQRLRIGNPEWEALFGPRS